MRVRIDEDTCVGDQSCVEICPQIFEIRGDVAVVKMEEVPEHLESACKDAVKSCPVEAIFIDE